jgi:RecA/RadA recombinase
MSKEKAAPRVISPAEQLNSLLDASPDDHYNNKQEELINGYKISTGSLKLDIELGGGLDCGAHRFIGVREGGKTSAALEVARNFQLTLKNRAFIVYFKAEGRLSEDILARSKIDTNPEVFRVVKSNIYEFVIDTMRSLCKNNPNKYKYLFIIDSVDGLISRAESEKTSEEAAKVGSSAAMLSRLFKTMSLFFSEHGHLALFISQERGQITINPYAPKAQSQGNSSGGNAIQHYVNFAINFKTRYKSDWILDGDEEEAGAKSKILGHWCKVELLKTVNDNTHTEVRYPIKRGVGVWREMEVADLTLQWDFYKKSGKWYNLSDSDNPIIKGLKEKFGSRVIEKFNGLKAYNSFFDDKENSDIVDYLYEQFKSTLLHSKSHASS